MIALTPRTQKLVRVSRKPLEISAKPPEQRSMLPQIASLVIQSTSARVYSLTQSAMVEHVINIAISFALMMAAYCLGRNSKH